MKLTRSEIVLSADHPSLLLRLAPEPVLLAPLIINEKRQLVDGYRRLQLSNDPDLEIVQVDAPDLFSTAVGFNSRTRAWDDIDCLLWTRWARSLNVMPRAIPRTTFPEEILNAPLSLLGRLANRKLQLRQALAVLRAPVPFQPFLESFLSEVVELNGNETLVFIEMVTDLKNRNGLGTISRVMEHPVLQEVLRKQQLSRRQKGEVLLKEMRALRYPKYQQKSTEFTAYWRELGFNDQIEVGKGLFLERGILELSFRSSSQEDLKHKIRTLSDSLSSPVWRKIWEE